MSFPPVCTDGGGAEGRAKKVVSLVVVAVDVNTAFTEDYL